MTRREGICIAIGLAAGFAAGALWHRDRANRRALSEDLSQDDTSPIIARQPLAVTEVKARRAELTPRDDGALVWEAEWANRITGSWACLPVENASEGAALWAREGSGRATAAELRTAGPGSATPAPDLGAALYVIQIPRSAVWQLWMRVWAEDGCGDSCFVQFGRRGQPERFPVREPGRYPYRRPQDFGRWVWIHDSGRRDQLKAGPHLLCVTVREDGFAIDQIALLPPGAAPPEGDARLPNSALPTADPLPPGTRLLDGDAGPRTHDLPPFDCVLSMESSLLMPDDEPSARGTLWVRSNVAGAVHVRVNMQTDHGWVTPGAQVNFVLRPDAPSAWMPVRIVFGEDLPRTAHFLEARVDSDEHPECSPILDRVFWRPFYWRALGPLSSSEAQGLEARLVAPGGLDFDLPPDPQQPLQRWRPLAPEHFRFNGAMNLGRVFDRPAHEEAFLATRIHVGTGGVYHLIAGADDSMVVWCDQRELLRTDTPAPLPDALREYKVRLTPGEHVLLIRTGQLEGHWQVYLEFRTPEGGVADDIVGLPPEPPWGEDFPERSDAGEGQ